MESSFDTTVDYVQFVQDLVRLQDKQLYRFFASCPDLKPFYCISWIITWFSHNLNDKQKICRVFDVILCVSPVFPCYLAASIILMHRDSVLLLDADMPSIHGFFNQLDIDSLDIEHVISRALGLYSRLPPSRISREWGFSLHSLTVCEFYQVKGIAEAIMESTLVPKKRLPKQDIPWTLVMVGVLLAYNYYF